MHGDNFHFERDSAAGSAAGSQRANKETSAENAGAGGCRLV
jgi:hypothetical protein